MIVVEPTIEHFFKPVSQLVDADGIFLMRKKHKPDSYEVRTFSGDDWYDEARSYYSHFIKLPEGH
jgi:hypothetical protein